METLERSLHPNSPIQAPISHSSNLENKISPSILLIIIIVAIIFFISGLLHLLVRFLLKPNSRDPDEVDDVTALQGQLQQLFYLHDAGVDQSFIDTLPLFHYSSIIGVKDPFDCAVCLCEFEPEDRLRLLPKCSHAFHTGCIDTWLLSHSTCPLCRSNLLEGFDRSGRMPIVCVLESGSDGSRELGGADLEEEEMGRVNSGFGSDRHLGSAREVEFPRKSSEIVDSGEKIVSVKLGKFRNVDGTGESSNNNNSNNNNVVSSRRCYSMGSFAYVMDENSSLQVQIKTPAKKPCAKKNTGFVPLKPGGGFRSAISEYGSDSRREFFSGIDHVHKSDRFSVSKMWGRTYDQNKEKSGGHVGSTSGFVCGRRTNSEIENAENGGWEEDAQSCYSVESTINASTTRRTLLWLMGRQQNKVIHNSSLSSSNV